MDEFNAPQRHDAPTKNTVTAVLERVRSAGDSLLSLLSGLLAAALILYSGYVLYDTFYTQSQAANSWDLLQYRPEIIDDGAVPLAGGDTLAKINEDYRAWLTMYETNIDYPVMQGENDLYYASHDVYGDSSLTGSIYLAAGNSPDLSDSYNLIYGHHMDNGAMFGALDEYRAQSYIDAHREGVIVTSSGVFDLYVFAVAQTDAYESEIYTVGNRMNAVLSFLREPGTSTEVLFFDEDALSGASRIVALSTCASAETNGRLVVFAVMTLRDISPIPAVTPVPVIAAADDSPASQEPAATPEPPSEEPAESEEVGDEETPLAAFVKRFEPAGSDQGRKAWALVNLICLLVTVYLFMPLAHIKAKFSRGKMMRRVNEAKEDLQFAKNLKAQELVERAMIERLAAAERAKAAGEDVGAAVRAAEAASFADITDDEFTTAVETLYYQVKKFLRRFRAGIGAEVVDSIAAIIAFLLTEDIRLPMILIDKWTPLMILLMAICWILDVRLVRYRNKVLAEEEEEIRAEIDRMTAEAH